MTLLEIRNQLFSHFLTNDTFTLETDVKKIKVSKNQISFRESLVCSVLDDLVTDKLVNKIVDGAGKTVAYVSGIPFGADGQEIPISNQTAELIANIVNQYRDAMEEQDGLVDKMAINEMDLQNLCVICASLLNAQDEEFESGDEGEDEDDS